MQPFSSRSYNPAVHPRSLALTLMACFCFVAMDVDGLGPVSTIIIPPMFGNGTNSTGGPRIELMWVHYTGECLPGQVLRSGEDVKYTFAFLNPNDDYALGSSSTGEDVKLMWGRQGEDGSLDSLGMCTLDFLHCGQSSPNSPCKCEDNWDNETVSLTLRAEVGLGNKHIWAEWHSRTDQPVIRSKPSVFPSVQASCGADASTSGASDIHTTPFLICLCSAVLYLWSI